MINYMVLLGHRQSPKAAKRLHNNEGENWTLTPARSAQREAAIRASRAALARSRAQRQADTDRQVLSLLASGAKQSPHIKALTGIGNDSLIGCRKRLEQAGKIVVESAPSPHGGPPTFVWMLK